MKNIRKAVNIPSGPTGPETLSRGFNWKVPTALTIAMLGAACTPQTAEAPTQNISGMINSCSIPQETIDKQIAAGKPFAFYIDLNPKCIGDQDAQLIQSNFGGKVTKVEAIVGLKPEPNNSNISMTEKNGDTQVGFFIYHLDNGKDIGIFPGLDGSKEKSSAYELNTYVSANDQDHTIEYSYGYSTNGGKTANTVFTVSWPNSKNLSDEDVVSQSLSDSSFIGSLGQATRLMIFNPASQEEMVVDIKPGDANWVNALTDLFTQGVITAHALGLPTSTVVPPGISTETPGAPKVPIIEVNGIQIPDPKIADPELFDISSSNSPVAEFANAFGVPKENVAKGLSYEVKTDSAGVKYLVARYNMIPDPNNKGASLFSPIVFIGKQENNGSWSWHGVEDITNGVLFGNDVKIGTELHPELDSSAKDFQAKQFNASTMAFVWNNREKVQGQHNLNYTDQMLAEAKQGGNDTIRLSHISSSDSEPEWLNNKTNDELVKILQDQVKFVMETYGPQGVTEFNVVNEPSLSIFTKRLGLEKYLTVAYQEANTVRDELINQAKQKGQVPPVIKLGFSDAENHFANGAETSETLTALKLLADNGWLDYVDVHFHIKDITKIPTSQDVSNTLMSYHQIINKTTGQPIEVVIGEMDFNISKLPVTDSTREIKQGNIGYEYFKAILAISNQITFWGAVNNESWYTNGEYQSDPTADPLTFNDSRQPKPLEFALAQAIIENLLH